jgi:hypothetical protein
VLHQETTGEFTSGLVAFVHGSLFLSSEAEKIARSSRFLLGLAACSHQKFE